MPDGNTTVIIQGKKRFKITEILTDEPFMMANVTDTNEEKPSEEDEQFSAIIESIKELALQIIKDSPNIPSEASFAIKNIESNSFLVNFVSSNMNLTLKEKQLHQQIKTIQEELGGVSHDDEIEEMRAKGKQKKWNKDVKEHFDKELSKMQRMNPQVAEYSIQRNYLELFLDLPWDVFSTDKFDLKRAQKILDTHHYGLEDVKLFYVYTVLLGLVKHL